MDLAAVAPGFVEMAHAIVWASVATVDSRGRPRSRILHPIWVWEDDTLTGWIATSPTPVKRAHFAAHPYASVNYWNPQHDTCVAECGAELVYDDATRTEVWNRFVDAPAPVGYDPRIIPVWTGPTAAAFAALKLTPWRLRVMPGTFMTAGQGEILNWQSPD